ncbi:MAG: hypothetical protein K0S74_757 [Chlamydiales bacterium]|jgi:16S rRNA (uracil1498-N3)-methyltransferase|nr:hypothetical protein [Chlamydiales bacterium]
MPAERYFIQQELKKDSIITLDDQEFIHLSRVMRTRIGETVEVINGAGALAVGELVQLDKRQALIKLNDITIAPKPSCEIVLAQAIPRPNRLSFILEKGTELGVTHFCLFPGEGSEKGDFSDNQLLRHEALLIAALKQCGSLFLPKLSVTPMLKNWEIALTGRGYYGDVSPQAPKLVDQLNQHKLGDSVTFFVGPERGFTQKEIEILQKMGVIGVSLNRNILRTDTAGISALSIISQFL